MFGFSLVGRVGIPVNGGRKRYKEGVCLHGVVVVFKAASLYLCYKLLVAITDFYFFP